MALAHRSAAACDHAATVFGRKPPYVSCSQYGKLPGMPEGLPGTAVRPVPDSIPFAHASALARLVDEIVMSPAVQPFAASSPR